MAALHQESPVLVLLATSILKTRPATSVLIKTKDCQPYMHGYSTVCETMRRGVQFGVMYAPFRVLTNGTQIYTWICVDPRDEVC